LGQIYWRESDRFDKKSTFNFLIDMTYSKITNTKVLVTGGAGFIGSNLCANLLENNNTVICLDNFSTGKKENIENFLSHKNFTLITGDIRNLDDCRKAAEGVEIVLQQAALGSVPRSINDPITTNEVHVGGFLNMLVAARDANVKRFVYAASSSTYGDSKVLPKTEDIIGKPLSPYAVTKLVNELYAHVFGLNYGLQCIGLRYFNVYGRNQDPDGAYAAAIPKFTKSFMEYQSPIINGDGTNSRDFTYIDNVIQMNHLAALTQNKEAIGQVFNTAVGERADLNQLTALLKQFLSEFDKKIEDVNVTYGPERAGDIPHSLASIEKAETLLGYKPSHTLEQGLKESVKWYWEHLK
jgi:UDP-N-acetylglucosamine/UDP-N-acetylgalactosamine 4-epimerase